MNLKIYSAEGKYEAKQLRKCDSQHLRERWMRTLKWKLLDYYLIIMHLLEYNAYRRDTLGKPICIKLL